MAKEPKIYTPEEADQLIPALMELLPDLRKIRDQIFEERDKCDVEELTSYGALGQRATQIRESMNQHKTLIQNLEETFEKKLQLFDKFGCSLKSIEPGLVDFYTRRENELVYLCWKEGEEHIQFWHALTGGFSGRKPIS